MYIVHPFLYCLHKLQNFSSKILQENTQILNKINLSQRLYCWNPSVSVCYIHRVQILQSLQRVKYPNHVNNFKVFTFNKGHDQINIMI